MGKYSRTGKEAEVDELECLGCGSVLYVHDTLYSNINTSRAVVGQHTGNVFKCEDCECYWVDDFLSGSVHEWGY